VFSLRYLILAFFCASVYFAPILSPPFILLYHIIYMFAIYIMHK
jgi:hypothetical protein